MGKAKEIVLVSPVKGLPEISNFKFVETETPGIPENGILCETIYLSVDPFMILKFQGNYREKEFDLNTVPFGGGVGKIIASKNSNFKEGNFVFGECYPWKTIVNFSEEDLKKLEILPSNYPPSLSLGALGLTGMTAYFGLLSICQPKEGETVLITGASGAVGTLVGQIAKIKGCTVIGITSSNEKGQILKKEFGFDQYLTNDNKNLSKAIKEIAPQGIDCFFDNVGGPIFDAVMENLNLNARISLCGAICQYSGECQTGPRWNMTLVLKQARMEGFIYSQFSSQFETARKEIRDWIKSGKLNPKETIFKGIETLPKALNDMSTCGNRFEK